MLTSPLLVAGDKVFGFLDDSLIYLTVFASSLPQNGELMSPEFMRQSIVISSYWWVLSIHDCIGSVMCYILCQQLHVREWSLHKLCYSELFWSCPWILSRRMWRPYNDTSNLDYTNEKADAEYVGSRYLKAKLVQSAQFVIKRLETRSLRTWGFVKACFY